MLFSLSLHFLPVLSLQTSVCSTLGFCPVFWGHNEYKIVFSILVSGATWEKKTKSNATRGFVDNTAPVPTESRKTAAQKVTLLELMLGQIANFCPAISRNTIIRSSTSVDLIWQLIRAHYSFQSTRAHFFRFANFKLEQDERPEDLFQYLNAFFEDSLLSTTGGLSHHREVPTEDGDISSLLENTIVLL